MIKYILTPLLILVSCSFLKAQELTFVDAINKVSHQRMLTQKMLNCYLMLGSGVEVERAKKEMDESAARFEELMLELLEFAPSEKVVNTIDNVQTSWRIYSIKVLSFPNKTMGIALFNRSRKLMEEYDNLLMLLEKEANIETTRLINLSSRQGMLAQRMEMLYLANYWKLSSEKIGTEFKSANEEFEETLNILLTTEINTPSIREQLNAITENWGFIRKKFDDETVPLLIIQLADTILEYSTSISKKYTELTKKNDVLEEEEKE